jgi:hypothetical protein
MELSKLTLGDIAKIEAYANLPISAISDEVVGATKLRIGLAWAIKKQSDPKFTFEMAEALTMADVNDLIGEDEEDSKK